MKILTGAQIRELDKYTIEHEPISSVDLMERSAKAITNAICERWAQSTPIVVFAGPGNNGGDALAMSRLLAEKGYVVDVFLFNVHNHLSEECAKNRDRLVSEGLAHKLTEITSNFEPPQLTEKTLVVDGLFGSGLKEPLSGGFASLVSYINQSPAQVVSIDIPSGLMTENNRPQDNPAVVRANVTLTLHTKKLAMFFADCQQYLGEVCTLDIRLSKYFIDTIPATYDTVDPSYIKSQMLKRDDFAHKGSMGNALLIAGSRGMAGAAILASKACMRSGAGKVTALTPHCNLGIMQMAAADKLPYSARRRRAEHARIARHMGAAAAEQRDYDAASARVRPHHGQTQLLRLRTSHTGARHGTRPLRIHHSEGPLLGALSARRRHLIQHYGQRRNGYSR